MPLQKTNDKNSRTTLGIIPDKPTKLFLLFLYARQAISIYAKLMLSESQPQIALDYEPQYEDHYSRSQPSRFSYNSTIIDFVRRVYEEFQTLKAKSENFSGNLPENDIGNRKRLQSFTFGGTHQTMVIVVSVFISLGVISCIVYAMYRKYYQNTTATQVTISVDRAEAHNVNYHEHQSMNN